MITHVVLLKLQDAGLAPQISTALKALKSQIPGIINITTGVDCSPEGLQRGFTHGFTVDFVDAAARDAYLPHPAHQKVGAMIVAACEGGIDGVLVLDWEI
jgi:Stress responsive A/B Barrel Domain